MNAFTNADWSLMIPEIALVVFALVIFTIDLLMGIRGKRASLGVLSVFALLIALALLLTTDKTGTIAYTFVLDPFAILFKIVILAGTALVILMSMAYLKKNPEIYQGEFYYLLLFAAAGAMLMVSSVDLVTLYIGLEVLSIASYCLAGFRKQHLKSNEAAMKYVILGGVSSAFILYGISFVYGLTGTTNLLIIGSEMAAIYDNFGYLVIMSLLFMLVGFGFKISSVPFHMWAPDVYEGAPTPITAFLSVVSKVAVFGLTLRVLILGFGAIFEQWYFFFGLIAAMTMIIGNIVALAQKSSKRLMAYSGIAQAGYLLVPLAAALPGEVMLSQIVFYAFAYLLMTLGAFAVITFVTEDAGSDDLSAFSGLHQRSPFLAFAMAVFLFSLAGLPVTAGFFGKFYIFLGVMTQHMYWLAIIMAVTSIISFYYYFTIIKHMYMAKTDNGVEEANQDHHAENQKPLSIPVSINLIVLVALIGTVLLGVMPNLLTTILNSTEWMIF